MILSSAHSRGGDPPRECSNHSRRGVAVGLNKRYAPPLGAICLHFHNSLRRVELCYGLVDDAILDLFIKQWRDSRHWPTAGGAGVYVSSWAAWAFSRLPDLRQPRNHTSTQVRCSFQIVDEFFVTLLSQALEMSSDQLRPPLSPLLQDHRKPEQLKRNHRAPARKHPRN